MSAIGDSSFVLIASIFVILYVCEDYNGQTIKNIYARKKEMLGEGKHLHTTDDYFLKDAETLIFNEFSFVLGKAFSQVKEEALKILNIE